MIDANVFAPCQPSPPAPQHPVLVTGATGFVGRHLVHRLLDEGCAVRAFALPDDPLHAGWAEHVEVVRGDVMDPAAVEAAVAGMDTVFHLAAVTGDWVPPAQYRRVNVEGTRHVLQAAAQTGARVVLASSTTVYGDALGQTICYEDQRHGKPCGPYSRSKQLQEQLARGLAQEAGLQVSIVRPANVYGPGNRRWIHAVVARLRRGLPLLIGRTPKVAGLTHVENVVDLFLRAARCPQAIGRTYNASDGLSVTWFDYFTDLARLLDAPPPKTIRRGTARVLAHTSEPAWRLLRLKSHPPLTREVLNLVGSNHRIPITRAHHELGYRVAVSYEQGLQSVAAYVREVGL